MRVLKYKEIERKFLVISDEYRKEAGYSKRITQGFLSSVPERTVRVRKVDDRGWVTVKGLGNESGTTRFEWEMEISGAEAGQLLEICEPGIIGKTRYFVRKGSHTYEVDEFEGQNHGLVIAEIELASEDEPFDRPGWLGEEVTGQVKYYNAALSRNPYSKWP
jgi:adenylate cyclase